MQNGIISNIQRFSLNDGPGIRTTVFFKGCNLRCKWCHNPETFHAGMEIMLYPEKCIGCAHCVRECPRHALTVTENGIACDQTRCNSCGHCAEICYPGARTPAGKTMSVDQVMDEVRQDKAYYKDSGGGVTLSGGEVFRQSDFAGALTEACRAEDISIAAETNLLFDFEAVKPVLRLLDLIMFDVKIFDSAAHKAWTGSGNEVILQNVRLLDTLDIPLIARTPVIPGASDGEDNIGQIAAYLKPLNNLRYYELLNFNPLGEAKYRALRQKDVFADARPPAPQDMARLAACAAKTGIPVRQG